MSKFSDFINSNKAGTTAIAVGVIALIAIAGCRGFSIDNYVKFKAPKAIQEATDSGASVSLSDAPFVRDDFLGWVDRNLSKFDRQYTDAARRAVVIKSLASTGLDAVGGVVPAGGILTLALGSIGGLMIKGPGTTKREAQIGARADAAGYARAVADGVAAAATAAGGPA